MTILKAITELNIDEIKEDFGDCDWMRGVLNGYTVDAILWLIHKVDKAEEWISIKDKLPEIPEGHYGVTVLVTTFDSIYEEINPGHGQSVTTMTLNKEYGAFGDFLDLPEGPLWMPSGDPVTHWMPMPEPPERG